MDDHPRRPRPVDLALLEDAEQAWFRPGTARRHRVRGLLVVVVVLALVLGGFALGPAGLPIVFLGILLGPLAAHAFSVALNAGRVWGLDAPVARVGVRDVGAARGR